MLFKSEMKDEKFPKILDYSLILLYDCSSLSSHSITNRKLIEIFIRNSLKVPSLTRLVQYFEEHIGEKSATHEGPGSNVREWIKFHNRLRKRPGYEKLVPFTTLERTSVKDIRFVKYKILSCEVQNSINGMQTFDFFNKKRFIIESPADPEMLNARVPRENSGFNKCTLPKRKFRDNLPTVSELEMRLVQQRA